MGKYSVTFKGRIDNNVLYLWNMDPLYDGLREIYILFNEDGNIAITAEYDKHYCDDKKFAGEILHAPIKLAPFENVIRSFIVDIIRKYLKNDDAIITFITDDYHHPDYKVLDRLSELMIKTGVGVMPCSS